jgi:hypothetical protein
MWLILLFLGIGENSIYCDKVVLNKNYTDEKTYLEQLIFYEYNHQYKRFDVRSWMLVNDKSTNNIISIHSESNGYHTFRFFVEKSVLNDSGEYITTKKKIVIKTKIFQETITNEDPEVLNKKFLEEKDRNPIW